MDTGLFNSDGGDVSAMIKSGLFTPSRILSMLLNGDKDPVHS